MSSAAYLLDSGLAAAPGLRHGFFTRRGGVSRGELASLNCGRGAAGEDAANIVENRARAAAALGAAPERLLSPYQTHSAKALIAHAPWGDSPPPRVDALATRTPGLAIGVLSADCAPVLFADPKAGVVGAAHAGWRGALAGVLEATVSAMERLGAERSRIRAAVGPAISQAAYEVGPEFRAAFLESDPASARFFAVPPDGGRCRFDLPGYALCRLERAGVIERRWIGRCVHADESRFYSYRRAGQRGERGYGRLLSAIVLSGAEEKRA